MEAPISVLLVEDSPSLAALYQEYLRDEPYRLSWVDSLAKAKALLECQPPQLLLLDLKLPDGNGLELLAQVQEQQLPLDTVVISAHGNVDVAVEAMRMGAIDFLNKPFDAKRLIVTMRNAVRQRHLSHLVDDYRDKYEREQFYGFIGASPAMQAVYRIIENAAPSKASVFITGESGTGKEVCADALHQHSPRRDRPFIALNCAAIPHDLMESEIFGHVKGAFTGAQGERQGAASLADGGTLFLDELCEMDLDLQSKLLRFIQTGTLQKVGSGKLEKVDVRFVCATNRDPWAEVEAGRLREDLYYRLHVIPIQLPPLRDRGDDVLLLARRLLNQYSAEEGKAFLRFSPAAESILRAFDWPGNVRQLQNVVRNLVVLNDGEEVSADMLPPPLNRLPAARSPQPPTEPQPARDPQRQSIRPLWLVERETIEQAIELCKGNIPRAAALLEISPSTIYRKKVAWEEQLPAVNRTRQELS